MFWVAEIAFSASIAVWLKTNYGNGSGSGKKNVLLALVISNGVIFATALITLYCSFDVAGRSWVKLKNYQKSLKESEQGQQGHSAHQRLQYKRSGTKSNRSWRHR